MTTTLNHSMVSETKTSNNPRISFGAIGIEVLRTSQGSFGKSGKPHRVEKLPFFSSPAYRQAGFRAGGKNGKGSFSETTTII